MKNRDKIIIFIFFIICFSPIKNILFAVEKPIDGGRINGMGGAFVGIADDVNSIDKNPAGLSQLKSNELEFIYTHPYLMMEGINLNFLGLKVASLLRKNKISKFNLFCEVGGGISAQILWVDTLYKEELIIGSIGFKVWKIKLGVGIKLFRLIYTLDNETLAIAKYNNDSIIENNRNISKNAISLNIGILNNLENINKKLKRINLGIVLNNILPANLGIKYTNILPVELEIGLGYKGNEEIIGFDLSIDYNNFKYLKIKRDINFRMGFEKYFFNKRIFMRGGMNFQEISIGGGYKFKILNKKFCIINYTISYNYKFINSFGNHTLSIKMMF